MVSPYTHIIEQLPYSKPFLFVDELLYINENGAEGTYTFDPDHFIYKGHFVGDPVTPGVILSETMAQIGVVCLGIWLLNQDNSKPSPIALTSMDCEYLKPVYPGEKVTVKSQRKYFRFGKLKCEVEMCNAAGQTVCSGTIAGIMINRI